MNAIIFITVLLGAFTFWGLKMTFLMAVSPKSAHDYMQKQSPRISRLVFRFASMFIGVKLEFDSRGRGDVPDRFIVISNHQSLADIPFLIAAFPSHRVRFVAKKSLGKFFPMVSPLLRFQHPALISRSGDFSLTYRSIRTLAFSSRRGIIPVVFPEGTRSRTGDVGPFHEGAARMLLQVHPLPVVTVAIDGGYALSRLRTIMTRKQGARYRGRITSIRPAPENKGEIVSLLQECRKEIVDQLETWRTDGCPAG